VAPGARAGARRREGFLKTPGSGRHPGEMCPAPAPVRRMTLTRRVANPKLGDEKALSQNPSPSSEDRIRES
jgi:hypothetical protein